MTFDNTPEQPRSRVEQTGVEADAALDHALREQVTDEPEFDDADVDDDYGTGEYSPVDEAADADAADAAAEGEEYVLYSEVKPHLEELVALQKERLRLIDLLLYARDRVSSPAAGERVDEGLARLGITLIRPDGERFDPSQHEAAATVDTDDPDLHGLVAETETAGYSDNGRLVRPPIVTVYRSSQQR